MAFLLLSNDVRSQPVDTLITAWSEITTFNEPVAMDVDPAGQVYVVDAGAHSIVRYQPMGSLQTFGGPGEAEGQFDGPADIDATNGLVLVIADAGNGRIQRFSREFLFLESLAVTEVEGERGDVFGSDPSYRQREQSLDDLPTGRPVGLITSPNNEMYAINEADNVVIQWDKNRNVMQTIGGYDQGDGSLIEPVSLAIGRSGALFVADRGNEAIMVYDAYGGFDRTIAEGLCAEVESVLTYRDRLLVVLNDKLLVYYDHGLLEMTVAFSAAGDLVDFAIHEDLFYLLTTRSLVRGENFVANRP